MPYPLQRLLAIAMLVVASPVLAAVGLTIRFVDGAPVLFRQTRIGKNAAPFTILKFRTMKNNADALLAQGGAENRLTRTGRWLRKSGLDELPQLLNVAKGEMAIVGPRAMLPEVAENLPQQYWPRFSVLPGITGLAQVSGRNQVLWSARLAHDLAYVSRRCLRLDLSIIIRTMAVLRSGAGHVADRNTESVDDLGLLHREGPV